ncbi:MAG: response regulator [Gammaproteobacteria bacterium]|nr:response regulator [Gammaproteobacteria bacterium]
MPSGKHDAKELVRILVLDDDAVIRDNLATFLSDEEFAVITAASGEQALNLVGHESPDIGIIDIRLPGMDGNAFVQAAHRVCPDMKFLIHTGSVEYCLPPELRQLGVSEGQVLHKPIGDMSLLLSLISRLVAHAAA